MAAKPETESQQSCGDGIEWREEWLSRSEVIRSNTLQVRHKVDDAAVRRYCEMTKAGSQPPPIKVAAVTEGGKTNHYLIDGFHRWAAGALVLQGPEYDPMVLALVAPMSMREAAWAAADANMRHGVQLKRKERRDVFRAFIRAGKHRTRGGYLTGRQIAATLMMSHSTIAYWLKKDFPGIAQRMGSDAGAAPGGLRELPPVPSRGDEVLTEVARIKGVALSLPTQEKRRVHAAIWSLLQDMGEPETDPEEDAF
ncbi:hypothetical protein GTZ97_16380 [Aquabacterium fontiphilum]|uniref:hypothetical protein n=1 Tax=Aquabacterium fontiphilum TaxID=450365 RepID=UPI001376995D|nr:hypothetical protein [Aquabacterium fontiphilum]NBD22233.1 hypothetical protein [Aquabacterium fontiphilum]